MKLPSLPAPVAEIRRTNPGGMASLQTLVPPEQLTHGLQFNTVEQVAAYGRAVAEEAARVCARKADERWKWWDARADPADQGAAICAEELETAIRQAFGLQGE